MTESIHKLTVSAPSTSPLPKTFQQISSGSRLQSSADDAAGVAIAQRMQTQLSGLSVSIRNAGDGISLTQVASGSLEGIQASLGRVRDLALQSANGTLTNADRQALNAETRQLMDAIQTTLKQSNFNGISLFDSDKPVSIQVDPNGKSPVEIDGTGNLSKSITDIGLFDLAIDTQQGATSALNTLDDAMQKISHSLGDIGASAKRLEASINNLSHESIATSESHSRINDSDLAGKISELSAQQIKEKVGIAIQAQANTQSGFILRLLS